MTLLREIELATATGKATTEACPESGIREQTYFRWDKEYDGPGVGQANWLKELERENTKLKGLLARSCPVPEHADPGSNISRVISLQHQVIQAQVGVLSHLAAFPIVPGSRGQPPFDEQHRPLPDRY